MTAPIQEPSIQRNFQGTAWATRQLARRPAPVSEGGPVPWIRRLLTSDESIASGTNDEEIAWDETINDYPEYFDTTLNGIDLLVDGLYGFAGELVWSGNKVEGSVVSLNSNTSPGFNWNKGWYDAQNAGHTIEHTQTFYYERRCEANTRVRLFVVHFAAAARTILGDLTGTESYMEVRYLGEWAGYPPED